MEPTAIVAIVHKVPPIVTVVPVVVKVPAMAMLLLEPVTSAKVLGVTELTTGAAPPAVTFNNCCQVLVLNILYKSK